MLDIDLAKLYGYDVKRFNEQVQRNIDRFPNDFMFELTNDEYAILKSQIATSSWGGARKLPHAFTEQGIYMLSTVLNGELAVKQSIYIMRTFKEMRHYVVKNKNMIASEEYLKLSIQVNEHTKDINIIKDNLSSSRQDIDLLHSKMNKLMDNFIDESTYKEYIFLNGQKFEADEVYTKIYKQAKESIIIIDDYISIKTLSLIKNRNVNVTIISDNKAKDKLTKHEYEDFKQEYFPITFIKSNKKVHDRYIVLDYKLDSMKVYACGSSSKDSAARITTILQIQDVSMIEPIVEVLMKNRKLVLK